jgi:hypothetical protein
MARPANEENRLEVILENSQKVRDKAKSLLDSTTSRISMDFETRYGMAVFQTVHLKAHLEEQPEWVALKINQDVLFSLLRELGWALVPIRIPAPSQKQIKAWKKGK